MSNDMKPWAEGGAITNPGASKVDQGWVGGGEKPGHETFNWWQNRADHVLDGHTTLHGAIADVAKGDNFVLNRTSGSNEPGESITNDALPGATAPEWIDSDGEYVVVARGNSVELFDRADLTTVVRTFTPASAGTVVKCLTNGEYVAAAYGNYVEVWNRDTGTQIFQHDHTAAVRDIAMNYLRICLVGVRNAALFTANYLTLSTGASVGTYDHGAELYAVANCYTSFVMSGADGGTGANKQVVRTSAAGGVTWEIDPSVVVAGSEYRNLACNGSIVGLHNGNTGVRLLGFAAADGYEVWSVNSTSADGSADTFLSASADAKNFYFTKANALYAVDPRTGHTKWSAAFSVGGTTLAYVNSDSDITWVVCDGTTPATFQVENDILPCIWRRIDSSGTNDDGAQFYNLATPEVR